MPRVVISDVDGPPIDSIGLHAVAWVEISGRSGIDVNHDEVRAQVGKGGSQLMPMFLNPDRLREQVRAISGLRSDLFKRDHLPHARAFPGVRPVLERIKAAGRRVVLATSGKGEEVDRHVRSAEIGDPIDAIVTADDAERSEPAPHILAAALDRVAPLGPGQGLVVGDSPLNAQAAAKIGLSTVSLLCGGFAEEALRAAGCHAILRDPADLLERYDASSLAP